MSGRPTTLPTPLRELAEAHGGVGELAQALGYDASTIRRWGTGALTPTPLEIRGLDALAREKRLHVWWPRDP